MATKQSLLERFDIPINHLDYKYIDECHSGKEIEKIVLILRSGQEGYFPDLTRHAEERLKILKPNSKVLRTEAPLLTKGNMESEEWKELNDPIKNWIGDIREKDRFLVKVTEKEADVALNVPPIRKNCGKIEPSSTKKTDSSKPKVERIKSTDYNKWDKFDADTEVLKMDLEEERAREEVERMNRLNLKKSVDAKSSIESIEMSNLTDIEKENLSLKYKERGNDYFRAKEYKEAIEEYTQCISILPTVNGYNNRALAYLKLKDYDKCIEDSDSALQLEPQNVKAMIRKAKAYNDLKEYTRAHEILREVLLIDPMNDAAKKEVSALREKFPDLPPVSATRMQIIEENPEPSTEFCFKQNAIPPKEPPKDKGRAIVALPELDTKIKNPKIVQGTTNGKEHTSKRCDNDLANLIMPNKIIKSKFKTAVEAMGKIQKSSKNGMQTIKNQQTSQPSALKIIPISDNMKKRQLIEEL